MVCGTEEGRRNPGKFKGHGRYKLREHYDQADPTQISQPNGDSERVAAACENSMSAIPCVVE